MYCVNGHIPELACNSVSSSVFTSDIQHEIQAEFIDAILRPTSISQQLSSIKQVELNFASILSKTASLCKTLKSPVND